MQNLHIIPKSEDLDYSEVKSLYISNKVPHSYIETYSTDERSCGLAITHSKTLKDGIKTVSCDFSSISNPNPLSNAADSPYSSNDESMAILTIVSNDTFLKSWRKLGDLRYRTGLINSVDRDKLQSKIMLRQKLTYISNRYSSEDTHILYQTKSKTELVSLNNRDRLIELVGIDTYNKCFEPLVTLVDDFGETRAPIADILKNKIDKEGISGVVEILKKLSI